jgi:hypothetical protein
VGRAAALLGAVLVVAGGGALGFALTRTGGAEMTPEASAAMASAVGKLDGDIAVPTSTAVNVLPAPLPGGIDNTAASLVVHSTSRLPASGSSSPIGTTATIWVLPLAMLVANIVIGSTASDSDVGATTCK